MTNKKTVLEVQKRDITGKKVKQLRKAGNVVGNISVPNKESILFSVDHREVDNLFKSGADSNLLYVKVGDSKKEVPCLLEEVQRHPVKEDVLHVMFRMVNLKEKVETEVPLQIIGDEETDAGAILFVVKDTIEVRALPTDIPEMFELDITELRQPGDALSLADLTVDTSKVELVISEDQELSETVLVQVQEQREEEEPEDEPEELEEPELVGEEDDEAEQAADAEEKPAE